MLDAIFCSQGGDFKNEIVWHYRRWTGKAKKFQELHDTIFFYVKSDAYKYNVIYTPYTEGSKARKEQGVLHRFKEGEEPYLVSDGTIDEKGVRENDVWQIPFIAPSAKERLGYPTQKPEALLAKIVSASSDPGDVVLDAYCGCGTTIAVAEKLGRRWIGCDLGRWGTHVTRKRMLGIENCKPFEVLNLGRYERQYWQGVTFGEAKNKPLAEQALYEYLAFILKLYGAQPVAGLAHLHGKKGKALVHIGPGVPVRPARPLVPHLFG